MGRAVRRRRKIDRGSVFHFVTLDREGQHNSPPLQALSTFDLCQMLEGYLLSIHPEQQIQGMANYGMFLHHLITTGLVRVVEDHPICLGAFGDWSNELRAWKES